MAPDTTTGCKLGTRASNLAGTVRYLRDSYTIRQNNETNFITNILHAWDFCLRTRAGGEPCLHALHSNTGWSQARNLNLKNKQCKKNRCANSEHFRILLQTAWNATTCFRIPATTKIKRNRFLQIFAAKNFQILASETVSNATTYLKFVCCKRLQTQPIASP